MKAVCINNVNSEFQKCITLHFQVTVFLMHLGHCISFIELSWNREEGENFTSNFSLDNWQPLHHRELLLSLNIAYYYMFLWQMHMPETEICMFRICYTMVNQDNHNELTKIIFGVNYHNIRRGLGNLSNAMWEKVNLQWSQPLQWTLVSLEDGIIVSGLPVVRLSLPTESGLCKDVSSPHPFHCMYEYSTTII